MTCTHAQGIQRSQPDALIEQLTHENQDQRREIEALVSERDALKADNARLTSRNLAVESTLEEAEYEAHKFEDGAQRFYGTIKTLRLRHH